jgi:uncharacterized UPF0160 family protein
LPQFSSASIVRTRNPELLAKCDVVVDVGAVYEPSSYRFDHHQREFTGNLENYCTKLSSAGLIYKHFGHDIIRELLQKCDHGKFDEELVNICYDKLYHGFVEHIDAIDNGIPVADSLRYHISSALSDRVHDLNPNWNEESSSELQNERFLLAMQLTCSEFLSKTESLLKTWWPARSLVVKAIENRYNIHPSGDSPQKILEHVSNSHLNARENINANSSLPLERSLV